MQVVPDITNKTHEFERNVSQKGQITLPLPFRKKLGVKDRVVVRLEGNEIKVVPAPSKVDALFGSVPALKSPKTLAEMRQIYQDELAEKFGRSGA